MIKIITQTVNKKMKLDGIQFDQIKEISSVINSPIIHIYLEELVHPKSGVSISRSSNKKAVFPDDYYAIFISSKKITSKKQLMFPHCIKLWSTMEMGDSSGNEKNIASDTTAMISTILTFLGNEVFVNNELFSPSNS